MIHESYMQAMKNEYDIKFEVLRAENMKEREAIETCYKNGLAWV